jgi:hypothetical protein
MSAAGSGRDGKDAIVMNSFHSRRMKRTKDSSRTEDDDFVLLEEPIGEDPYAKKGTRGPPGKTYDVTITRQPDDRNAQTAVPGGIQREIRYSVTHARSEF